MRTEENQPLAGRRADHDVALQVEPAHLGVQDDLAGGPPDGHLVAGADVDGLFDVHVKAPFFLTQALLPLLADGGRILNVSSGLARFTYPGNAAYAAAKGAVEVLTRYQAAELGDRRIRVNVLVPGAIATDFGGGLVRDNKQVNEAVAGAIPLGRAGEPDDIGAAVPLILADGFAWANGTRIELSGGQNL